MSSKTDTNLPPAGSSSPIGEPLLLLPHRRGSSDKSALVQTRLSPAEQANRQSEIRKILIQTMRLTSKLREQLKVGMVARRKDPRMAALGSQGE